MGSAKNNVTGRTNYISRKEYNNFIDKYSTSDVTYEQFISVLKLSSQCIRDHVLENPLGFKLPKNLGYVAVKKFKTNKEFLAIDWINTNRLGKIVPLTNMHSFGYAFKIEFFKNPKIKPLIAYKMNAHRLLKRALGKIIKGGKYEYINIDKNYFSKRFHIENYLKNT